LLAIRKAIVGHAKEKHCPPKESADFIYSQVIKFVASPAGQKGTFTPYPATWMNEGRYSDDPAEWWKNAGNGKPNGNGTTHPMSASEIVRLQQQGKDFSEIIRLQQGRRPQ